MRPPLKPLIVLALFVFYFLTGAHRAQAQFTPPIAPSTPTPITLNLPYTNITCDPVTGLCTAQICDPVLNTCTTITMANPDDPLVTVTSTGTVTGIDLGVGCALASGNIEFTMDADFQNDCNVNGFCTYNGDGFSASCTLAVGPSFQCSVTANSSGCTFIYYWNPAPTTLGGPIEGEVTIPWPTFPPLSEIPFPTLTPITTGGPGIPGGIISGVGVEIGTW